MTTKEDMPKRVTDPMLEQLALLMETNRKQSEIIESQAKTIEELRASFHAGPQTGKGGAIIANAVIQHLQHIAQALAVSTQLGKALAGLLL